MRPVLDLLDPVLDRPGDLAEVGGGKVADAAPDERPDTYGRGEVACVSGSGDGDAPLSTECKILHIEEQGNHATALLYRRMSDATPPLLYELRLQREVRAGS